jgi:hypothetical protein
MRAGVNETGAVGVPGWQHPRPFVRTANAVLVYRPSRVRIPEPPQEPHLGPGNTGLTVLGLFNTSPADYGQLRLTTGGWPEYVPKWSAGSEDLAAAWRRTAPTRQSRLGSARAMSTYPQLVEQNAEGRVSLIVVDPC